MINAAKPVQRVILYEGQGARPLASEMRLQLLTALLDRGYLVTAIRPPTVPPGTSRLRITFSAAHQDSDVQCLVAALSDVLASLPEEPPQSPARHG